MVVSRAAENMNVPLGDGYLVLEVLPEVESAVDPIPARLRILSPDGPRLVWARDWRDLP